MDRVLRLSRFWSWLPAFRAVGECGHLPTAAREVMVTPSALSRAVRLLEQDLGTPLFERSGRKLLLNDTGRRFLDATRDAMRILDEAVAQLRHEHLVGPVHIGSTGAATTAIVVPALVELRKQHPRLLPIISSTTAADVGPALRRGALDVAFHGPLPSLPTTDGITTSRLGTIESGVYAARGHALFGKRRVAPELIHAAAFVCPPDDPSGRPSDGWPVGVPREVAMVVDQLRVGVEICLRGDHLAVLPDLLVKTHPLATQLRRLPFAQCLAQPLLASQRQRLGFTTRGEVVLAAVRATYRALTAQAPPAPRTR